MNCDEIEIEKLLPHRKPFLFADGVEDYVPGKSAQTFLRLDSSLPFFAGHFPNEPVMPGVLITEAMAQAAGVFMALESLSAGGKSGEIFYLASSNIKFVSVARPPETLRLTASFVREFQGLYYFSVEALADRRRAAGGTVVLASAANIK